MQAISSRFLIVLLGLLLSSLSSLASAYHDCAVEPVAFVSDHKHNERLVKPKLNEEVTLWRGNNWKGKVFVITSNPPSGKMWVNYFGKEQIDISEDIGNNVFDMDAPSNGAELKASYSDDNLLVMVCVLKDRDETPDDIVSRLTNIAKKCKNDEACWLDQNAITQVPHSSTILPDR